jgi:hypothetical protein
VTRDVCSIDILAGSKSRPHPSSGTENCIAVEAAQNGSEGIRFIRHGAI